LTSASQVLSTGWVGTRLRTDYKPKRLRIESQYETAILIVKPSWRSFMLTMRCFQRVHPHFRTVERHSLTGVDHDEIAGRPGVSPAGRAIFVMIDTGKRFPYCVRALRDDRERMIAHDREIVGAYKSTSS
jgi:hypothetical protein